MVAAMRTKWLPLLVVLTVAACGGGQRAPQSEAAAARMARPGGNVDLLGLVPTDASVVLHTHLDIVRADPARYEELASGLARELGLMAESTTLHELLDHTNASVGAFVPSDGSGSQEGLLLFAGSYSEADFEHALSIAHTRHGSAPQPITMSDGRRIYALGDATLVRFDQWTWGVSRGPAMRAHLTHAPLGGPRRFRRSLAEFGRRIGLPSGSAQAWARQDTQAGTDMVALVFAGEHPQMVEHFVSTVARHLGL